MDYIDALAEQGWFVGSDLLAAALIGALAADAEQLAAGAAMQPAAVGRSSGRQQLPQLRGDHTFWIEAAAEAPVRRQLLEALDGLRLRLNRELQLGLSEVECHYACYPPGAGYGRHLDRFRDHQARTVSFTCYLNRDWQPADGGQLRLFLPTGEHDIVPQWGVCTLFLSDRIEHAVLPSRRPRLSIAGWFRRPTAPFQR